MKRLVLAVFIVLSLLIAAVTGCTEQEAEPPSDEVGTVSTCVTCHTDKDTLKAVASPEEAETESEATSGEG